MGENKNVCNFIVTLLKVGQSEASRVCRQCIVRTGGRLGDWNPLFLIWWIHVFMDFSYWPHMSYAKQNLKVKDKYIEDFVNQQGQHVI